MKTSIFASVVAYEDPDVWETVTSLIGQAMDPIRVAIVLQGDDYEQTARDMRELPNTHVLRIPRKAARGVGWARHLAQTYYEGEEFYYQTDSHANFHDEWDVALIDMMDSIGKPTVISTYPRSRECYKPDEVTVIEPTFFGDAGLMGRCQDYPGDTFGYEMIPARLIGGGHLFAPGSFVVDVPHDPQMYFAGEEFAMTLRAWTHGYHLAHPRKTVCCHLYDIEHRRRQHWDDHADWGERDARSKERVAMLTGWPRKMSLHTLGAYGLGKKRTLRSYEDYAGVRIKAKEFTDDPTWRTLDVDAIAHRTEAMK